MIFLPNIKVILISEIVSALHVAIDKRYIEIVKLLLSQPKINVFMQLTSRSKNSSNIIRLTPLDLAKTKNNQKIIDIKKRVTLIALFVRI